MTWRIWATFWFLCVIWGTPYFFIKLALLEVSPAVVAWSRITLGALILVPIAWYRGSLQAAWSRKGAVLAFALCEMVGPFTLISLGEQWISSSLAGVLIATAPVTVILVAPLFGIREHISARRWMGLLVAFAGVIALLGIDSVSGTQQWLGVACMAGAVIGYSCGPLIVQRHLGGIDEVGAVAASLLVASVVLLPLAALTAPQRMPAAITFASLAALGVFCTALAMLMFFHLIHGAGAARAAIVAYVNPAVAALLGVWVLDEHFGWGMAVGLILILSGSWLATGQGERRARSQEVAEA